MLCFAGNPAILFLEKTVIISVLQIYCIQLHLAKYLRVSLFHWLVSEPMRLSEGCQASGAQCLAAWLLSTRPCSKLLGTGAGRAGAAGELRPSEER